MKSYIKNQKKQCDFLKNAVNLLYSDNMTAEEMQELFKKRYNHIDIDVAGKMPKEQVQLLLREYDLLLQEFPVGSKLMEIKVGKILIKENEPYGLYSPKISKIIFNTSFVNKDIVNLMNDVYNAAHISTNKENHVYIHEFAHALDRAINKDGKTGRQLLLEAMPNTDTNKTWEYYAGKLSKYAMTIPENTKTQMYGGEFFAEAFAAYYNNMIPKMTELQWIVDFFDNLSL